jgi:hypothetical protein
VHDVPFAALLVVHVWLVHSGILHSPAVHVAHPTPPFPHALTEVPAWHVVPLRHPGHPVHPPPWQIPPVAVQSAHTDPLPPHALLDVPPTHDVPFQHPVQQLPL